MLVVEVVELLFLNQTTLVEMVVVEEEDKDLLQTQLLMEQLELLILVVEVELVVKQVELELQGDQELLFLEDQVRLLLHLFQGHRLQCQLIQVVIK
jgi:hypothetical protein